MMWLLIRVLWFGVTLVAAALGTMLHGELGGIAAVFVTQGAFWLTVVWISQALFPIRSRGDRLEALGVLLSWLLGVNGPCYVAKDGKVERRLSGGMMPFAWGVLLVDVATAVVLERFGRLSRICGPGIWFTLVDETARGAVDLRPQIRRRAPVTAVMRDGIYMTAALQALYQLQKMPSATPGDCPEQPFGYDERAVHWVVYRTPVHPEEESDWGEVLVSAAIDRLRALFLGYKLDQLYQPAVMAEIKKELRQSFAESVQGLSRDKDLSFAIDITSVGFGLPRPPQAVLEQRIQSWRTPWAGRVLTAQAQGDAAAVRHLELARAVAQREMITSILHGFADLHEPVPRDLIRLRLVAALEHMLADPNTRDLVPREAMDQVRGFLRAPGTGHEGG